MDMDFTHVSSRLEFSAYLTAQREELRQTPDAWENSTLERFLEAVAAWVADSENSEVGKRFEDSGVNIWHKIALLVAVGKSHE